MSAERFSRIAPTDSNSRSGIDEGHVTPDGCRLHDGIVHGKAEIEVAQARAIALRDDELLGGISAASCRVVKIASRLSSTGRTKQAASWLTVVPAFITVGELGRELQARHRIAKRLGGRLSALTVLAFDSGYMRRDTPEHPGGRFDVGECVASSET